VPVDPLSQNRTFEDVIKQMDPTDLEIIKSELRIREGVVTRLRNLNNDFANELERSSDL